ncbi:MAG: hypothetical protein ABF508_08645 [Zymomonas mobilis]
MKRRHNIGLLVVDYLQLSRAVEHPLRTLQSMRKSMPNIDSGNKSLML